MSQTRTRFTVLQRIFLFSFPKAFAKTVSLSTVFLNLRWSFFPFDTLHHLQSWRQNQRTGEWSRVHCPIFPVSQMADLCVSRRGSGRQSERGFAVGLWDSSTGLTSFLPYFSAFIWFIDSSVTNIWETMEFWSRSWLNLSLGMISVPIDRRSFPLALCFTEYFTFLRQN